MYEETDKIHIIRRRRRVIYLEIVEENGSDRRGERECYCKLSAAIYVVLLGFCEVYAYSDLAGSTQFGPNNKIRFTQMFPF